MSKCLFIRSHSCAHALDSRERCLEPDLQRHHQSPLSESLKPGETAEARPERLNVGVVRKGIVARRCWSIC